MLDTSSGSCQFDCPHQIHDANAEDLALMLNDRETSERIKIEREERQRNCATVGGTVVQLANGEFGCALEHADPQVKALTPLGHSITTTFLSVKRIL